MRPFNSTTVTQQIFTIGQDRRVVAGCAHRSCAVTVARPLSAWQVFWMAVADCWRAPTPMRRNKAAHAGLFRRLPILGTVLAGWMSVWHPSSPASCDSVVRS